MISVWQEIKLYEFVIRIGLCYVPVLKLYFCYFGKFNHVPSQIAWYICSMYLGPEGGFFF
jgi:hypothetical protein